MNHKILYIEDDPSIAEITKLTLESLGGFTVTHFFSGYDAITQATKINPALILLDIMMPNIDGVETLKQLRLIKELKNTPVIFMTAKVQSQEIAKYQALKVDDIISKPYDPQDLCDRVKKCMIEVLNIS